MLFMLEILQKLDIIIFNHSWPIYIFRLCKIITQAYDLIEMALWWWNLGCSHVIAGVVLVWHWDQKIMLDVKHLAVHSFTLAHPVSSDYEPSCKLVHPWMHRTQGWSGHIQFKISSSCFPDNMTVKRKAQNHVRLERHQSNAWIMMTYW